MPKFAAKAVRIRDQQANVRLTTLQRIQRFFTAIGFVALICIILLATRDFGIDMPWLDWLPQNISFVQREPQEIAIISGHAGSDSGAICSDDSGAVTLTEADVNAQIAALVERRLTSAGYAVVILDEYDSRLRGLQVDAVLSLHSDSCVSASGYKATYSERSPIPELEEEFLACVDEHYPAATQLEYHPYTVTHDMLNYHAFNRIDPMTPSLILEMGFLGGDQDLLTTQQGQVADGIVTSLVCFLDGQLAKSNEPTESN